MAAIRQYSQLRHLGACRVVTRHLRDRSCRRCAMNLLATTVAIPLLGFFIVLCLPRESKAPFIAAFTASLAAFFVSLALIPSVLSKGADFSSVVDASWIDNPSLGIHFHLGVDGINLWPFLLPIAIWAARSMIRERQKTFYALLLLFEFGIICVFSALDLFLFYVFWE